MVAPYDLDGRFKRVLVDSYPLDSTLGGPLTMADLRSLKCGSRRARCRQDPVCVSENNLGVGTDVNE